MFEIISKIPWLIRQIIIWVKEFLNTVHCQKITKISSNNKSHETYINDKIILKDL
jgi:hypothetical protein